MACVTMFRVSGDPADVLAMKREHVDPVTREAAEEVGALAHIVCNDGDGILIINVFADPSASDAMIARVRPVAEANGLGPPENHRTYDVEQLMIRQTADEGMGAHCAPLSAAGGTVLK